MLAKQTYNLVGNLAFLKKSSVAGKAKDSSETAKAMRDGAHLSALESVD
jgi:hypothetical protein